MTHLSDLEIAAVIDQGVPQGQSGRIEQHLQRCGYCAGRVEESRAVMAALAEPASGLWEQVTEKFFQLRLQIPVRVRSMRAELQAAGFPAGLRFGHEASGMLDKPSSKQTVRPFLEVPSPNNDFLFKLSWKPSKATITDVDFQVVDRLEASASPHATVQLRKKDGQMLEWRRTDENGRITFEELEEGEYLIQVTYYDARTVEIPFSLKGQNQEEA